MKLAQLLQGVNLINNLKDGNLEISDVVCDSSQITKGCLFICLTGENYDGHCFIRQAEQYGAKAVVCERELPTTLTQIIVEDSREAMGVIACNFYDNPAKKLTVIGVTGTNGKTSTTQIIYQILNYAKINCGVIGTLGAFYKNKRVDCKLTTPDPLVLNKILFDMVSEGVNTVVMEVSAHAIYYRKLIGIDFKVGVFTNLTQDHLDFFGTIENYSTTKKSFFVENKPKYLVTNVDDELGREISRLYDGTITYGIENPSDVFAINFKHTKQGVSFVINLFDCVYQVKLKLVGLHNVYNALASLTVASLVGVSPEIAVKGLERINGIEGRLNKVFNGKFCVYVDYAHTPDGLEKTLFSLRPYCKGSLISVFGCGGNRDALKRSIMGEISAKNADFTIITSDNPRFEDPMEIILAIEQGVLKHGKNYVIIEDRRQAIEHALEIAKEGDVVLVAGKGGEKYQDVLGIKKPFDDYAIIIEKLQGIIK